MAKKDCASTQYISLDSNDHFLDFDKKKTRIEVRSNKPPTPFRKSKEVQTNNIKHQTDLKTISAYCVSESIKLRALYNHLEDCDNFGRATMYYNECLHVQSKYFEDEEKEAVADIIVFNYGVIVIIGLDERNENRIIKDFRFFLLHPYEYDMIEVDSFRYGIVEGNALIQNDIIYATNDDWLTKIVLATAIAQSLKLDHFENLADKTILTIKDLPDEVNIEDNAGRTRRDILKLISSLHKLRFDINLATNIPDKPEILYAHSEGEALYDAFKEYLSIQNRANILNHRCIIIQDILDVLKENINTKNSESLEKSIVWMMILNLVVGLVQIGTLIWLFRK